jgi:osmoprotectant transport system permease protein
MAESIDWDWIDRHTDDITTAVVQHVELVAISMGIAIAIALPVAIAVRKSRVATGVANVIGGELYVIPSLALFAFLVPSLGIGRGPVIVGLVIYALGVIVRNAVVGLQGVPGPVREAARGMGMTGRQTLFRVELPLAVPAIMTGIRIATVSTVGIATIGTLVAAGGLGDLIFNDGINRDLFLTPIVVGAVLATALAVVLDLLLLGAERLMKPWARAGAAHQ